MAWPWLAIIAKSVPWVELARRTPDILARSRELLEEAKRPRSVETSGGDLVRRVEALEARDAEHARLIAPMVEQLSGLTDAVEVLTARNKLLTLVAVVLVAAQIVTLVLVLR